MLALRRGLPLAFIPANSSSIAGGWPEEAHGGAEVGTDAPAGDGPGVGSTPGGLCGSAGAAGAREQLGKRKISGGAGISVTAARRQVVALSIERKTLGFGCSARSAHFHQLRTGFGLKRSGKAPLPPARSGNTTAVVGIKSEAGILYAELVLLNGIFIIEAIHARRCRKGIRPRRVSSSVGRFYAEDVRPAGNALDSGCICLIDSR